MAASAVLTRQSFREHARPLSAYDRLHSSGQVDWGLKNPSFRLLCCRVALPKDSSRRGLGKTELVSKHRRDTDVMPMTLGAQ